MDKSTKNMPLNEVLGAFSQDPSPAQLVEASARQSMLTGGSLNEQLAKVWDMPDPRELWGPFVREGDLCTIFAGTGRGKTALALQILASVTTGKPVGGFGPDPSVEPMKGVLIDMEMTPLQLKARLHDKHTGQRANLGDGILRYRVDPQFDSGEFLDNLVDEFRALHEDQGVGLFVIDNLTFLLNASGDRLLDATRKLLLQCKVAIEELGVTVIVVNHTLKQDNVAGQAVQMSQQKGASDILNGSDSLIGIGKPSDGGDLVYLKQFKGRTERREFGGDKVAAFNLKHQDGWLHFVRNEAEDASEAELNAAGSPPPKDDMLAAIASIAKKYPNASQTALMEKAGFVGSQATFSRRLSEAKAKGLL